MMRTWTRPNYPLVYRTVKNVRQKLSPSFKPSMKELINLLRADGVAVNTYDQFAKSNGVDLERVPSLLGSEEGATLYDGWRHLLYYDKHQSNQSRKNWTITHEAGHIFLGHLQKSLIDNTRMSSNVLNVMEQEANFFAKEFLAPSSLVLAIVSTYTTRPTIYDYYLSYRCFFHLSKQASSYCAKFMHKNLRMMVSLFDIDYIKTYQEELIAMQKSISIDDFIAMHDYMSKEYKHDLSRYYVRSLTHVSKIVSPCIVALANKSDNK